MMGDGDLQRQALRRRLHELEAELVRTQAELVALGVGEPLPGVYVVFDVGPLSAVLPAALVFEIVRLVEFTPLPQAPAHVSGSFLYRGEPAVGIDLATLVGHPRLAPLDAHVMVLATERRIGLVVDRVRTLVEAPVVADPSEDDGQIGRWGSRLVAGLCRSGEELLPLLDVGALVREGGG
ncbi:MAG: chemotaxis protein CheW [Myxococcales bacterium]|jgi:purine-binding chemotaxis protein CheW